MGQDAAGAGVAVGAGVGVPGPGVAEGPGVGVGPAAPATGVASTGDDQLPQALPALDRDLTQNRYSRPLVSPLTVCPLTAPRVSLLAALLARSLM